MEDNGVLIDTNVLSDISLLFTSRLNEYQSKVYEITGETGKKTLIPAVEAVVRRVDPQSGVMTIRPIKGMFDDED